MFSIQLREQLPHPTLKAVFDELRARFSPTRKTLQLEVRNVGLMLTPALQEIRSAQEHQAEILKQCATWIDEGKLKIHLSQTFPLSQAARAHQAWENGTILGKTALIVE